MVNFNGELMQENLLGFENRGYLYGDAVFETLRVVNQKVLFLEDHYFRLMASMRICRMEIPMAFDLVFFEKELLKVIDKPLGNYRVRFNVFRSFKAPSYAPFKNEITYFVESTELEQKELFYTILKHEYNVDLYKDFFVSKSLLSTIKTNNKMINVLASRFYLDFNLDNALLLNTDKNLVEATNSNIFLVIDNKLITPALSDGCLNGIIRKQLLTLFSRTNALDLTIEERSISPFELQKAEEVFLTNVVIGIQPITKYRKKKYPIEKVRGILEMFNSKLI